MSSIGWIDFSSEHREKVKTVIDLLAEKGVLDELGIGVVRNAFADRMFPGITTIHTRAKYFSLTALLLKDYEENECQKRKPRSLDRYLEEEELEIRIQLVERHGEGRQALGIIGSTFGMRRDRAVIRRPSSVYWAGLKAFGIVTPKELSLAEFGRRLTDKKQHLKSLLESKGDEAGDDSDALAGERRIQIHVPDTEEDYWDDLTIKLTPHEAEFLSQHITASQPNSLLGRILADDDAIEQVLTLPSSPLFQDFARLPFIENLNDPELKMTISHARDFWTILEGAHIRYNCLLQEADYGTTELRQELDEEWEDWKSRLSEFPPDWDSQFLWQLVGQRVGLRTRAFINNWIEETRNGCAHLARCNELVRTQELRNKGKRARLRHGNELSINSWIGISQLDYRIGVVRQLVQDIHEGKGGSHA